jgi:hypothetical protein
MDFSLLLIKGKVFIITDVNTTNKAVLWRVCRDDSVLKKEIHLDFGIVFFTHNLVSMAKDAYPSYALDSSLVKCK